MAAGVSTSLPRGAAAGQPGTTRHPQLPRRTKGPSHGLADLVGLGPSMLLYLGFVLIPIFLALVLSFYSWNGLSALRWVGGANWSEFFQDPVALHSLEVTGLLVVISWAVQTPLSMALGMFVAGRQRYRAVYAALYLLPLLLSTTGIALVWQAMLDPSFGGVAWVAQHLGLSVLDQNWLGDPATALPVIIAIIAWQFVPFHTLLYQVGRRQIPEVLYEAAALDGASPWQRFCHVTLPQLRYTIVVSSTLMIVGSLTYFDIIFILTTGGPGDSTRVLAIDMYQAAFANQTFGYASVLAVVLGVIGIAVALGLVRATGFGSMESQREGVG